MAIDKTLIDQLLADYKKPEDIIGENGLLKQLTKALLERALQAELTDHLGFEKHDPAGHHSGNSRNGTSRKALKGDFGELELETPRDRQASFEPVIVAKGQSRFTGFDDKIISMYARGMSTREIQGHLQEIYGIEVSPALISNVTEAVVEEVKEWHTQTITKPILPALALTPLPHPRAFLITPAPFILHKCLPTGGFLQTAVSDAPPTTSRTYLPSRNGAHPIQH